jgi:PHP family Zn ribbon phosphoesterase
MIHAERGLKAWSVDLHVHTPESTCYSEPAATPEYTVDAAVAAGLDAIAVTDHNSTAALDRVRLAAGKRGLFVFPGMEVSTASGHVLGIFDLDTAADAIADVLEWLGIPHEARGDGTRIANVGMDEVFRAIGNAGGLAIAAHVDRWPSGLLHSCASLTDRVRLLSSEYLSALEITVPGNKHLWNTGQVAHIPRKLACVQGSDAHAPAEIGRRRVLVTMAQVNLASLREALAHNDTSIVFPDLG